MGFFDGNTVTARWNYAQHYTMSDNYFNTVFEHSTPGALNLVSGQTHGATPSEVPGVVVDGTVISDPDPTGDDCSSGTPTISMSGRNVGDIDSRQLEQASVRKLIEDNWGLGRIGDQSFDERATSIAGLFDFRRHARRASRVLLDGRTGEVRRVVPSR